MTFKSHGKGCRRRDLERLKYTCVFPKHRLQLQTKGVALIRWCCHKQFGYAVINSSVVCEHPWSLLQCCLREEANARVSHNNCLWWSARHLLFIEHTVERFHSRVVSELLQFSISKFKSLARHGKDHNWKLGINIEVCAFGESPSGNKKGDLFWKIFSCDSSPNIIIQENIFQLSRHTQFKVR